MIFFIWSLVANALDYLSRSRLAQRINMYISRPGCFIIRRISRNVINSCSTNPASPTDDLFARAVPVYEQDDIQIRFADDQETIALCEWHTFGGGSAGFAPIKSRLSSKFSTVYFTSKLSPYETANKNVRQSIEDKCKPIAWRTDHGLLKVLFSCAQQEFAELICDWKDNLFVYRNFFDLVEIKTCDIVPNTTDTFASQHLKSLSSIEKDPMKLVSPPDASENGSLFRGLEQLCLADILSAKELCRSLATFSNNGDSPASSTWGISLSTDNVTTISAPPVVSSQPQSSRNNNESSSGEKLVPPVSSTSTFGSKSPNLCPGPISIGTLSPVDEVSTPLSGNSTARSNTNNGNFLSLFNGYEVEDASGSCASISAQHRDEDYYKRNSRNHTFKDKTFAHCMYKNMNGSAQRSLSLTSVSYSPVAAADRSSTLSKEYSRRRRTASNHQSNRSKIDYNDALTHSRRFSTSTPSIPVSGVPRHPSMHHGNDSSSGLKFRRLSTLKSLGLLGPVIYPKPPNILVYCGSDKVKSDKIFDTLRPCLCRCLNTTSRYLVYKLEHASFLTEAPLWPKTIACLVLADLSSLDEAHWEKLYDYFRFGGKLLFLCENGLFVSLRDCHSVKKRFGLLKLAFEGRQHSHSFLSSSADKDLEKFLKKLSTKLDNKETSICEQTRVNDNDGRLKFFLSVMKEPGSPLIFYLQNCRERAGALFSDVGLDYFAKNVPEAANLLRQIFERLAMEFLEETEMEALEKSRKLTPGYLYFDPSYAAEVSTIADALLAKGVFRSHPMTLDFKTLPATTDDENSAAESSIATADYLPIFLPATTTRESSTPENVHFDTEQYFSNLHTKTLGKVVVFVRNTVSSMPVCTSLALACPKQNFVVIADIQTAGRGRTKNQWLSPVGCAMFSFNFTTTLGSRLASHSGYFQHLLAIAIVDGLRSQPGFGNLDIRIKWPNDIYYGRTVKIGGALVNCTVKGGSTFEFIAGAALNVANSTPTLCINDVLPNDATPFTREQVIAIALSRFEELVDEFEADGYEPILPLYYKYWLHEYQELTLEDTQEQVVVRGLDKHGYLQVRSRQSGKLISLQPNENSLDMMHNLLRIKTF